MAIRDNDLIDLLLASSSRLPLDSAISESYELLAAGRQAAWRDNQHELAHDYFVESLATARSISDIRGMAKALLAISAHLIWFCPQTIEDSELDVYDICELTLRLFTQVEDETGIADSLHGLDRCDEALAISRRIGYKRGIVLCLRELASRISQSDSEKSLIYAREAVEIARQDDDAVSLANGLLGVAMLPHAEEAERRSAFLESRNLYHELGYCWTEAQTITAFAVLACDRDPGFQTQLLEEARQIWLAMGNDTMEATCRNMMADMALERKQAIGD